jgi:hypothetical protein
MIFGEQLLLMLVICYFFAMMSIMFTKHSRFADLQKKLEVVKRKIEVSYRFGFSNEGSFRLIITMKMEAMLIM